MFRYFRCFAVFFILLKKCFPEPCEAVPLYPGCSLGLWPWCLLGLFLPHHPGDSFCLLLVLDPLNSEPYVCLLYFLVLVEHILVAFWGRALEKHIFRVKLYSGSVITWHDQSQFPSWLDAWFVCVSVVTRRLKILPLGETGWRTHKTGLYYFCNLLWISNYSESEVWNMSVFGSPTSVGLNTRLKITLLENFKGLAPFSCSF